jgi:hypothetical protein
MVKSAGYGANTFASCKWINFHFALHYGQSSEQRPRFFCPLPLFVCWCFFFSLLHTNFSFLKKHGWILFSGLSSSLFLYVCLFLRLLFGCRNVTVKRDEFISCFNYPFPPFFFLFSNLCYPFLRINGIGAIWSVFFCIFCSLILSFRFVILLTHLSLAFLYFFMGWGVG